MATSDAAPVLVTGATGNVGSAVVASLRAAGLPLRAAGQSPERVRAVLGDVDAVALDLRRREGFAAAVRGARGLFLLRPPAIADVRTSLLPLVDEARAAGVRHVVFLSVAGAGTNRLIPHHTVEQHLQAGPRGWTLLRPGFFAQNLGDAYRDDVRHDGRLYVPAGRGRVAFVDVRDVGDLAAAIFLDPAAHDGQAYTLTGPEAVTFAEAAALLSEALGRPIRYQPASVLGYARHLRRRGMPLAQIAVQAVLHVGLRFGQAARVDATLARLLGRAPRTLRAYIQDHAALWQGGERWRASGWTSARS